METIKRDYYLKKLITLSKVKMIKIITGPRRCGKSYLLDPIFKTYLLESGIKEDHIIKIDFDNLNNDTLLDAKEVEKHIDKLILDEETYYLLFDEIQLVSNFVGLLNTLLKKKNLNIYVSGSNSKFLSSDIATELRGRGFEIRVYPLSFKELYDYLKIDKRDVFDEYVLFGGMPQLLEFETPDEKREYLKSLIKTTYLKDIEERNDVRKNTILSPLFEYLASSVGSLTNPRRIANTFNSNGYKNINFDTIDTYIGYFENSFLIEKTNRFDVKGLRYINALHKYYFVDLGIRNAELGFRQLDKGHTLENLVYLELKRRGYEVDIGFIEKRTSTSRTRYEVDFVCNNNYKKAYVQVSQSLYNKEKEAQEKNPFTYINDNFRKIIIVADQPNSYIDKDGIEIMSIYDFLLDEESI